MQESGTTNGTIAGGVGIRFVPRINNRNERALRVARSRLDFTARDKVGIRFVDLMREAREFFKDRQIKDLADMGEAQCKRLRLHIIEHTNMIREKYPYWRG